MAEAAIAIAYPEPWNKGKALGYWLTYRLAGQILGGAINLGLNADRDQAGKVTYTVYLIFIALQCIGPVVGLFMNKPDKVQRKDGKMVELAILEKPWFELKEIARLFFTKRFLLILLWIGQAVFAEAVFFTYLARRLTQNSIRKILTSSSMVLSPRPSPRIFPLRHHRRDLWKPARQLPRSHQHSSSHSRPQHFLGYRSSPRRMVALGHDPRH